MEFILRKFTWKKKIRENKFLEIFSPSPLFIEGNNGAGLAIQLTNREVNDSHFRTVRNEGPAFLNFAEIESQ